MGQRIGPALLGVVALSGALAARPLAAQMTIGAKGGVNLATASLTVSQTSLSPGTRTAWHGGAVVGLTAGHGVAVEGQIRLTGKGYDPGQAGSGVNRSLRMDYVEFPLLAVFTFPRDPEFVAARAFAGPSFNLRASCGLDSGVDQTTFDNCDGDLSRTADVSAVVGSGIKIGRGLGGIVVDVSYDFGFVDVIRSGKDASLRHRNLLVSAGFVMSTR